jgi:hypothetical protein
MSLGRRVDSQQMSDIQRKSELGMANPNASEDTCSRVGNSGDPHLDAVG